MSELADFLEYLGSALDKPGRATRSLLSGRTDDALAFVPFSDSLGLTDKRNAVSGEDLFKQHFGSTGSETGDSILGFGTGILTDPTNLLGLGLGSRAARGASIAARGVEETNQAARASNALREGLLAKGAMPAEIAAQTTLKDAAGNPLRTYHGSGKAFGEIDAAKFDPDALYGPGYYTTRDPNIASEYATQFMGEEAQRPRLQMRRNDLMGYLSDNPGPKLEEIGRQKLAEVESQLAGLGPRSENVRMQFMDFRNPFNIDKKIALEDASPILAKAEGPRVPLAMKLLENKSLGGGVYGDELYGLLRLAAGGKPEANEVLKKAGFDSITHTGGRNIGTVDHPVAIALDPKQVYKPWVAPPEQALLPQGQSAGRAFLPYLAGVLGNTGVASQASTRRPPTISDLLLSLPGQSQQPTGTAGALAGGAVGGF